MSIDDYSRLVSTNTWNYPKPSHNPGYKGYVPTLRYTFGETFGNATEKYFADYRSRVLSNSISPARKTGTPLCELPDIYTDPKLVMTNRDRTQARWTAPPNYRVVNYSADMTNRNQDIQKFNQELVQKQREVYKDKTGTKHPVPHFVLPNAVKVVPERLEISHYREPLGPKFSRMQTSPPTSNVRARMMRDLHFERR